MDEHVGSSAAMTGYGDDNDDEDYHDNAKETGYGGNDYGQ